MSELTKQAIDQPAHFLWAFGAFYIGLNVGPIGYLFTAAHVAAIIYREYKQWPSSRWYDPYLDWTFYIIGAAAAVLVVY